MERRMTFSASETALSPPMTLHVGVLGDGILLGEQFQRRKAASTRHDLVLGVPSKIVR
jgi:hypothetical protein